MSDVSIPVPFALEDLVALIEIAERSPLSTAERRWLIKLKQDIAPLFVKQQNG